MSKDHKGMIRGFHHAGSSWYAKTATADCDDYISIGFYGPDGDSGTTGEFLVKWTRLDKRSVPQLKAFDDGWHALSQFSDVLSKMADHDDENITPVEFCALLESCGVRDLTNRDMPRE